MFSRVPKILVFLLFSVVIAPYFSHGQSVREGRLTHTSYRDFLSGWSLKDRAPIVELRGSVSARVTAFGGRALPRPRGQKAQEWTEFPQPGRLYGASHQAGELDRLWLYHRVGFIGPLRWRLWGPLPVSDTSRWIVVAHGSFWTTAGVKGQVSSIERADETTSKGSWSVVASVPDRAKPTGLFLTPDDQLAIPAQLPSGETTAFLGEFTGNGKSVVIQETSRIRTSHSNSRTRRPPGLYNNRFSLGAPVRVVRLEWTLVKRSEGEVRVRYRCAPSDEQEYGGWSAWRRSSPIFISRICKYCEYQVLFPATFRGVLAVDEVSLVYEEEEKKLAQAPGSSESGGSGAMENRSESKPPATAKQKSKPVEPVASSISSPKAQPSKGESAAQAAPEAQFPGSPNAPGESEPEENPPAQTVSSPESLPEQPVENAGGAQAEPPGPAPESIAEGPARQLGQGGSPRKPVAAKSSRSAETSPAPGGSPGVGTAGRPTGQTHSPRKAQGAAEAGRELAADAAGEVGEPGGGVGPSAGGVGSPGGGAGGSLASGFSAQADTESAPAGAGPGRIGKTLGQPSKEGGALEGAEDSHTEGGSLGGAAGGAGGGSGAVGGSSAGGASAKQPLESPGKVSPTTGSIYTPILGNNPPGAEPAEIKEGSWRSYWPLLLIPLPASLFWCFLKNRSKRRKKERTRLVRALSDASVSTPPVVDTGEDAWSQPDGVDAAAPPSRASAPDSLDTSRRGGRNPSGPRGDSSWRGGTIPKRPPFRKDSSMTSRASNEDDTEEQPALSRDTPPATSKSRFPFFGLALPPFFYLSRKKRAPGTADRSL